MQTTTRCSVLLGGLCAFLLLAMLATNAKASTIEWEHYTWTTVGGSFEVNGAGDLEITADGSYPNILGGNYLAYASLYTAIAFPGYTVTSVQTTVLDSGPGGESSFLMIRDYLPNGQSYQAMFGTGKQVETSQYRALWGLRATHDPDSPFLWVKGMNVAPRTPGEHSLGLTLAPDGSTEFWFDGEVVHSLGAIKMTGIDVVTLFSTSNVPNSETATFTSLDIGTTVVPEPASLLLLGSAGGVMALWRLRRRARKAM